MENLYPQAEKSSTDSTTKSYQEAPPPYCPPLTYGYNQGGLNQSVTTPLLYPQQGFAVRSRRALLWNNKIVTPITSSLRTFLLFSGIFYAIFGGFIFAMQILVITNSYSPYYNGCWTGSLVFAGGISMLLIACRSNYCLIHLLRLFTVNLIFCIMAMIFGFANYVSSGHCNQTSYYNYCDTSSTSNMKLSLLAMFVVTTIHTIINSVVMSREQKRMAAQLNLRVPIV